VNEGRSGSSALRRLLSFRCSESRTKQVRNQVGVAAGRDARNSRTAPRRSVTSRSDTRTRRRRIVTSRHHHRQHSTVGRCSVFKGAACRKRLQNRRSKCFAALRRKLNLFQLSDLPPPKSAPPLLFYGIYRASGSYICHDPRCHLFISKCSFVHRCVTAQVAFSSFNSVLDFAINGVHPLPSTWATTIKGKSSLQFNRRSQEYT
jgi:hypothetical protein